MQPHRSLYPPPLSYGVTCIVFTYTDSFPDNVKLLLSAFIHILENLKREKYHLTRHLSFLLCFLHSWNSKFPSGNIFLQWKLPLAISLRANTPAVNSFVFLHLRIPLFYLHPWRMFSLHIEFCVGISFSPLKISLHRFYEFWQGILCIL